MSIESTLLDLKKQIETDKQKKAEKEGALKQVMEQLKLNYKCKSVKESDKKLTEMENSIEKMTDELNAGLEKLKNEYNLEI